MQRYKFSSEPPRILSKNRPFHLKFVDFIGKEALPALTMAHPCPNPTHPHTKLPQKFFVSEK